MVTKADLPSFQQYQLKFSAYLRDPTHQPRPDQVAIERIAVYEEIVFNNLFEAVSACFPVAQQIAGTIVWRQLVKGFLQSHSANSPIFRKIPEEFLLYLEAHCHHLALPPYFYSLCQYEWVELAVGSSESQIDMHLIDPSGNLLASRPAFVEAMQLLHYEYPVHEISADNHAVEKTDTHLLVYRNADDEVKFVALNAVTFLLMELLQQHKTGREALTEVALAVAHPQLESMMDFGLEILEDLRQQGVILGTYRD